MKLFIPRNENLIKIINQLQEEKPFPSFKTEKLIYILHLITSIPAINKKAKCINGYTPISSKALEDVVYNYKDYLAIMKEKGIIATDGYYIPEEKCYGFKILPQYSSLNVVAIEPKEFTLRKSITNRNKLTTADIKKHKHLLKWYNGLEVEYNFAINFAFKDYLLKQSNPDLLDKYTKRLDYYPFKEEKEKDPAIQYRSAEINLNKIQLKEFGFTVDETAGRLHTTLTNLPSQVRNFLTYKGCRLVCIDIRNSQPFFSLILLNPLFWVKSTEHFNVYDLGIMLKNLKLYSNYSTYNSLFSLVFMFLNSPETLTSKDFQRFKELCISGELYKVLTLEYKAVTGIVLTDPKKIKETVFQTFFTDNRFIGQTDAEFKRFFKEQFPTVYQLFSLIKKHESNNLPILLQLLESHCILHRVCKRIASEKPELPIFTIHDSIITTEGNEKYVDSVLKSEINSLFGFSPSTKTENLRPENAIYKDKSFYSYTEAA